MNAWKLSTIFLLMFFAFSIGYSVSGSFPNPGHPASEIGSGQFYGGSGDLFTFPGLVEIKQQLGIGVAPSSSYWLNVLGSSRIGGDLNVAGYMGIGTTPVSSSTLTVAGDISSSGTVSTDKVNLAVQTSPLETIPGSEGDIIYYEGELQYYNGTQWDNVSGVNKKYVEERIELANSYLGINFHSEKDCQDSGGAIFVTTDGISICRFKCGPPVSSISYCNHEVASCSVGCPAGWQQYKSWSATKGNEYVPNPPCGGSYCSTAPVLVTGSHSWSNTAVETAKSTNCLSNVVTTIYSSIVEIGCY